MGLKEMPEGASLKVVEIKKALSVVLPCCFVVNCFRIVI